MALAPGTSIGPYEVVAPLGAGGMGEVYSARDARLARGVAVKVAGEADIPIGFWGDGRGLQLRKHRGRMPVVTYLLDLSTGRRTPFRDLSPKDPAGVLSMRRIAVTPGGEAYAYDYPQLLSDLYLIEGLR